MKPFNTATVVQALFLCFFLLFSGCRKSDQPLVETSSSPAGYTALRDRFFNASSADPEVQKVAANIRRQDDLFKFLPQFVKKNGVPRWDKTVYKTSSGTASKNTTSRSSSDGDQGVFLIPLQADGSSQIKSYITAYKHSDSLYTYRVYNRDSINAVQAANSQQKSNLINVQAVFAAFEKSVNGVNSMPIQAPVRGTIKNAAINFNENPSGGRTTNANRTQDCVMSIEVTIEYSLEVEVDGDTLYIYESVSVVMDITIDCGGSGGGGGCGCSGIDNPSGDLSGGTGSGGNNYWWNYGTGWPWYNTWGTYDPNNVTGWYWWWTGGGYSGSGSGFSPTVDYLTNNLGLSWSQSYWLSQNPARANQIYNYLFTTAEPTAGQIALSHIDRMMTDPNYLAFVENHALTGDPSKVWWEDDTWLDDPNHISFDTEPIGQYPITAAERALIKKYPIAAAIILSNKSVAENYTIAKFGANGLNDKSDAFRHAFFQAVNAIDPLVGPSLTQQFSDAHESEVPPQFIKEKQMDLFNNSVGINVGQNASWWTSVSDLADQVEQKLLNGELRYLKPINAADPNFALTHGITSATALTPTNQ